MNVQRVLMLAELDDMAAQRDYFAGEVNHLRHQLEEAERVVDEVVERSKSHEQHGFRMARERNQARRERDEAVEALLSVARFYVGDVANTEEFQQIDASFDMPREEVERSLWRNVRAIVAKNKED